MGAANRFMSKEDREKRAAEAAALRAARAEAAAERANISPYERKFGPEAEKQRLEASGLTPKKSSLKVKNTQTRSEKAAAKKAEMKALFDKTKKAQAAKGQAGMTLKQRQEADLKASKAAAAKKYDEFQKKHKRGKYRVTKK